MEISPSCSSFQGWQQGPTPTGCPHRGWRWPGWGLLSQCLPLLWAQTGYPPWCVLADVSPVTPPHSSCVIETHKYLYLLIYENLFMSSPRATFMSLKVSDY